MVNKKARKLGLQTPKYNNIAARHKSYLVFKVLAKQNKMNYVDFLGKLLEVFVASKNNNYEENIADLERKQDELVLYLRMYQQRYGKQHPTEAERKFLLQ